MLIEEVKNRPPLYDYTLPLSARGRHKIAELWKEISDALHGLLSPEDAKKRWKSLKDTYSKAVAEEKKPSASARSCSQKMWKHFEAMSFLRSVSRSRNFISNLTVPIIESNRNLFEENSSDNMEKRKNTEDEPPAEHRAKAHDDLSSSINRIAEAFCNKDNNSVINLPKLPEIDALDGMFIYIKQRLLKLSQEKQNMLLMKFQQDIAKEEQNQRG
ncbi:uncharacterized protein LOC143899100 [Temnothorax americanus]|uniref:uncharacterized protein LOC143899100 n=1 Tax=Temnothorax americanus TaxID=1964332 RepID=UPI00406776D8